LRGEDMSQPAQLFRTALETATVAILAGSVLTCQNVSAPFAPTDSALPVAHEIEDGASGGANPHFFFLPPVQPNPGFTGTFDPALSPTVRICALEGSTCSSDDISAFNMSSTPPVTLDTAGENYQVNWQTKGLDLSPNVNYRIRVFVGDVLLGFADVDVVASNRERGHVPPGFVALVKDKPLQIRFRIETGIVGEVTVTPVAGTVITGDVKQFTAELLDLHGNPLQGASLTWATDNSAVATIGNDGVAIAGKGGTTAIFAISQNVTGTATLTVVEFELIVSGGKHSCGLTPEGTAYCWGYNMAGQLGNGTNTDSNAPVAVVGSHVFTELSTGGNHTCGVTASGEGFCWGLNFYGQLGDGTNADHNVPSAVAGNLTFLSLSASDGGLGHSCGLSVGGAAYCWGNNDLGQLGDGTEQDSNQPVPVLGEHVFALVSANSVQHNCGLTENGEAYCWGWNGYNQLGDGTNVRSNVPVAVSGPLTFALVSTGGHHSCGLTVAGDAYCWGHNAYGDLGRGTNSNGESAPEAVSGNHTFTSLNAGLFHSCGITSAGEAYCWGQNLFGALGNGTNVDSNLPVSVSGGLAFVSVSAGGEHSCGLTASGKPYCWGRDEHGQLGNGVQVASSVPVAVRLE
jgi:alpha-tubulin suppressor-like RCC1 family protein